MTDEALDIMNAGTEVSSEQLRMIDQDADLRKACEDIFVAQNVLAREQMSAADADEQLRLFHQRRRRARKQENASEGYRTRRSSTERT